MSLGDEVGIKRLDSETDKLATEGDGVMVVEDDEEDSSEVAEGTGADVSMVSMSG